MRKVGGAVFTTLTALLVLVATLHSTPARAASVTPVFVAGNPSCTSLGYSFGFKVDPPNAGTYSIDGINTVTVTTDGVYFDWSSTLGMDAVISKGGPNANVYIYDPPAEATSDTGLHSPINPNNGNPFGLSHIEFCFDYELAVSKTANTTFTRTFNWTIDKSVTPDTLNMFTGDRGAVQYTVAVVKTGFTDSNWAVSGVITIQNNTPLVATITGVSDQISGAGSPTPNCGVTFPHNLAAGGTLTCSYTASLPDGASRTNTATVTTSGNVAGGNGTAPVAFGNPTTVVNGTINVDDTNGSSWSFSDSGSVSYTKTFACDADEGTHNNTATIRETGQSDSATVTVNCYELTVTKNANTSLSRTWNWTIDKSANQTNLLLSDGQLFPVNYEVKVNASSTDSAWAVNGTITVQNNTPLVATITGVSDQISGAGSPTPNCGVTFPYSLAAGGTLTCSYTASLPDATSRTNTATATIQNYSYDKDGNPTPSGTTNFSGTAAVSFSNAAVTEIDECIAVSDTNVGNLGTVCAGDAPKTFTYSLTFGKHPDADVKLQCGNNTHTNIASFVTNDTGATGQDTWTVNANVACNQGCTLTQGYWKTHSHRGPAPADDAWFTLGDVDNDGVSEGADETFFNSGKTYYQVLWTSPQGNVYYNLAHQYIAAKLNILNGASSTTAVDAAITFAENFFATKTPSSSLTRAERNEVTAKAAILDNYNNGLIGPGHCSE
jgi:hypothetical protein